MKPDKKIFEFEAISWGDGKCMVFQVDLENFIKATDREPEEWELPSEYQEYADKRHAYRLYPDEFFPEGKKLKIKIEVETAD